jgi:hypothetical protein
VETLARAGADVLLLHSRADPVAVWAKRWGVRAAIARDLVLVTALVAELDCLAGCDSGLYHVAAVYGVPAAAAFACTRGDVIRRHYPRALAIDAGPECREGLACERPCYGFPSGGHTWECRDQGCAALARVPGRILAEAALTAALRPAKPHGAWEVRALPARVRMRTSVWDA